MFTSIDKAIVAFVMAVVYILKYFGVVDLGLTTESVGAIVAGLTPILVFLIPNRKTGVKLGAGLRSLAVLAAFLFAFAALLPGGRAFAEPPATGTFLDRTPAKFILCDTREQLDAIVEAGRSDGVSNNATEVFRGYAMTMNAIGEPACAVQFVAGVAVGEVAALGLFYKRAGDPGWQAWAVHVSNPRGAAWVLWMELEPARNAWLDRGTRPRWV